jgi:hypothetical protein
MIGRIIRHVAFVVVLISLSSGYSVADPLNDGRIAIVDISQSLLSEAGKPFANRFDILKKSGVLVIGRYFSRCFQGGSFSRKRLIDGNPKIPDAEANAILSNGFAIMSIYQYNNREGKFDGTFAGQQCIKTKYADRLRKASNILRNAILDAEAAIQQASAVHQPPNTVIYFGVDYNFDKNNRVQRANLLTYFTEVTEQLHAAHFRVGAYADGDALTLLQDNQKIHIAWLLPSTSFKGNSDFHTNHHWHLFQSQADNHVLKSNQGKCLNFEYDVNIQNSAAASEDLGFWDKSGVYKVPEDRTTAISNQRRFVCDRRYLFLLASQSSCAATPPLRSCIKTTNGEPCFIKTVRVNPNQTEGNTLQIDYHDIGTFDGTIDKRRLTATLATKPLYESAPWDRAACP